MWPTKNTAFVVIHGAGSHRPFDALDKFVRGFWNALRQTNPDLDVRWRHRLQRHEDWIEHYVSLVPDVKVGAASNQSRRHQPRLDFYEYYWDMHVDYKVQLAEVTEWLDQVSASAKKFYGERPQLARAHQQQGSNLFGDGDFKAGGYFIPLGRVARGLRFLQRVGLARIPVLSTAVNLALRRASKVMAEMMGDVVIYSTADVRSKSYAIRQRLLQGAVQELTALCRREDYEQIIVAGHSLGSVIAYDALNRIVVDMNTPGGMRPEQAQKITGLVTFGSPLDKVAFYFREQARDDEQVRQQILVHIHGFKSRPIPSVESAFIIDTPIERRLDGVRWLNFYHLQDPVSGHLDAYDVDENILCDAGVDGRAEAHSAYWAFDPMYKAIGAAFFADAPDVGLA
jgi:hypothetical protein